MTLFFFYISQELKLFQIMKCAFLRIIEIGSTSFPEIFHRKGMAQEVRKKVLEAPF